MQLEVKIADEGGEGNNAFCVKCSTIQGLFVLGLIGVF